MPALVTPDLRQPSRLSRLRAPVGAAAGVGLATAALHLRDPHERGSWGLCPLKALTGWNCPGCGGLRAVNDLTHGQLDAAVHSNLLLVGLIPAVALFWALWIGWRWSSAAPLPGARYTRAITLGLGAAAITFAVIRNTPWGQAFSVS